MRKTFFGLALIVPLLLAGCTQTFGVSDTSAVKLEKPHAGLAEDNVGSKTGKPAMSWVGAKKTGVALITFGSSSCPDFPVRIKVVSSTSAVLTMKEYSGDCTADFGPYISEFKLPGSLSRQKAVHFTLKSKLNSSEVTLKPSPVLYPVE